MTDEAKSNLREWSINAIEKLGYPIVISGALLYIGMQQLQAASQEAQQDRAYIRGEMHTLVSKTTEAITQGTQALTASTQAVRDTQQAFTELRDVLNEKKEVLLRLERKLDESVK